MVIFLETSNAVEGEMVKKPIAWRGMFNRLFHRAAPPQPVKAQPVLPLPVSPLLSPTGLESVLSAYQRRLRAQHSAIYVYGLDEKRQNLQSNGQALDLLALYVPLNTTTMIPVKSTTAKASELYKTRPLGLLEAVGREKHVIVRGPLGTARSTFLKFLALTLSKKRQDESTGLGPDWKHGRMFPVLIDLRDFAASEHNDETGNGLLAYIADELGMLAGQAEKQLIEPGGVLFLLNGLDAAPQAVSDLVCRYEHTDNGWIVTAQEYTSTNDASICTLDAFASAHVADLTLDQMDAFVRQWYAELARKGWIDQESVRDLPGQLCTQLRRADVFKLARRHSMLALITLLHTLQGRLAPNQTLLYHQLVNLTMIHWSQGRGQERDLRPVFDVDGLRMAVAQATYQAYTRLARAGDLVELPENDLRATLVSVCRQGQWQTVGELIARILTRPGLLEETRPGVFVFPHSSLQAYITARHLVAQPELPRLIGRLVQEDFYRWRQVIVLVVSRLILLENDLDAALAVLEALCPRPLPAGVKTQTTAQEWRNAWLAGDCLVEIETTHLETGQAFPPTAAPLLQRVRRWLTALLDAGMLAPAERAQAGKTLSRLPGSDPRPGVCQPEPLWCEVSKSPFWLGAGHDARIVEQNTFWIARYPVTNAQYAAFVHAAGHRPPRHWNGSHPPDEIRNHPVVQVTWKDATAYCEWLSGRLYATPFAVWQAESKVTSGRAPGHFTARLPTSAEWEKAARGGLLIPCADQDELIDNPLPRRIFPWGNSWRLSTIDAPGDETRCNVSESDIGATTPVGMYPTGASPYGVLDMAGNVWEWCHDWLDQDARYKARRGGAFRYTHDQARCSTVDKAHPGLGWPYMGFRVALGVPLDNH